MNKCETLQRLMASKDKISILFICSGNIIRSPYAEILFEQMIIDAGLKSRFIINSGAVTYHNSKISTLSYNELLKEGVSSSRIRSFYPRHIDDHPQLFSQADLILVMSREHLSKLSRFKDKSHLLTEFAGLPPEDVPDPYFESTPEKAYSMIKKSLQALISCISSN
ncbi:MAG: arsenate reductase/protein-tyrosine-phosphatase family protein [Candidatus Hodarchaeales archaeon]